MSTPSWLKDAGDVFTDPVSYLLGPQYQIGQASTQALTGASGLLDDPADPYVSQRAAVERGLGSLGEIAYDANGNMRRAEYMAPGQVSQSAFDAMLARSQNDPLQQGAENYFGNILAGNASNPYLDQTYNQAAGKVRSSLDSQFERAGRYGGTDHEMAMGGALGDLATNLYGGAYEANQGRMMQAAQIAPGTGYQGLARQAALGQQQDQQASEMANFDYNSGMDRLNQYLRATSTAGGAMPPPPVEQNDLANVLGIVTAGASLMGGNPLPAVGFMGQQMQQPSYDYSQPLPQYRTSLY